jgi:benzylsuccinate CoA-transferase BbsE subunit
MANEKTEGVLSPYRVLDLAGEEGLVCGKIMGDYGADVIKIEPPRGSPARRVGPFYHDEPDTEKSLFWLAYNTSKRGITLNLETVDGRDLFRKMVKTADFVIETFRPGYMTSLGLGYADLEKINPGIIVVSITPFGQTGPYKDWKAPELVAWAIGGNMAPYGDPDRPPIHVSYHSQAFLNAGADGAMGALMALYHRNETGEGQQVDVSIQEAVVQCTEHLTSGWDLRHAFQKRAGEGRNRQKLTQIWKCKDGYVSWFFWSGVMSERTNIPLVKWMESQGMADEFLLKFDWSKFDGNTTQEEINKMEAPTAKFFLAHTKAELFEGAVKTNSQVYPVSTPADMLTDSQLKVRKFWVTVDHDDLGAKLTYPGPFVATGVAPPRISRRAPLIGEHNEEIYRQLGLTTEQIVILREAGVI